MTQVQKLFERMCDIARGAALITGTTVDIKQVAAYSDLINNETLNDLIQENLERCDPHWIHGGGTGLCEEIPVRDHRAG